MRGLRDQVKRRAIFEYCSKRAEIVCLQETHSEAKDERIWASEWGGIALMAHNTSSAGGVCVLIKRSFFCNISNIIKSYDGRYIICDIETDNISFTLGCIYAPNRDCPAFFESIAQNLCEAKPQRVIVGDFNLTLNPEKDRNVSTSNNSKAQKRLLEIMDEMMLADVWRERNPEVKRFSWKRCEESGNFQGSRIDLALMSKGFDMLVTDILYFQGVFSDHSPLVIIIRDSVYKRGPGYWKLNTKHLDNADVTESCTAVIKKEINCTQDWQPIERYLRIKHQAIKFLKDKSRQIADTRVLTIAQLSEHLNEYEERMPLAREEMDVYLATKNDLEMLLLEKSREAIFRAKVKWAEDGEKGSKYFLNLERSRANAKTCHAVFNSSGQLLENPTEILEEQKNFYQDLYTADPTVNFNYEMDKKITEADRELLSKPFTLQEMENAIQAMPPGKTPGPDGLPAEFYKCFWPHLHTVMFNMYTEVFSTSLMFTEAMEGILNLIPKKGKDTRHLKNLRAHHTVEYRL